MQEVSIAMGSIPPLGLLVLALIIAKVVFTDSLATELAESLSPGTRTGLALCLFIISIWLAYLVFQDWLLFSEFKEMSSRRPFYVSKTPPPPLWLVLLKPVVAVGSLAAGVRLLIGKS